MSAVMVVQAGAARKVIDASPDQAAKVSVGRRGRRPGGMAELRHVMGLLTMKAGMDPDRDPPAPQPGLDQLPALGSAFATLASRSS